MAKITNFQLALNFSDEAGGQKETVRFDDLTDDISLEDVEDEDIRNVIKTRQERGVKPNPTIVRSKNFMLEEIRGKRHNRNIIEKLCIEARLKYNKDPKKNEKPMIEVDLVIGGQFVEGKNEISDNKDNSMFLKLQKQQMTCILKYLDYSQNYTKFQTGVQKKFLENKFKKEERKQYLDIYEEWVMVKNEQKDKQKMQKAEKLKEKLADIESEYTYETIAALRQVVRSSDGSGTSKYDLEKRKKQEREEMLKKIKDFENSKSEGYISGFFGGKSTEDKAKDRKDIQEYKARMNKEFESKFAEEEKQLNEKMDKIMSDGDVMFDPNALKDMPDEWVRMIAAVIIPEFRFILFHEDSTRENEKAIMEAQSSGMRTKAYMGQDFQEIQLSFGEFNIIDNFSGSFVYQYLTETVFPGSGDSEGKDAVEIVLKTNPRFTDGQTKIKVRTNAHQYIFANMKLISAVQDFFAASGEKPEDQIDLSYYTEQAKVKALEYINQGADYLESTNQNVEYVHSGIDADIEVFAPVIVIPEDVCNLTGKKTLVFSLGYTRVTSEIVPYAKDVDYKLINSGEHLYDRYDLKLNGFQLSMIEELVDYKHWYDAKLKVDIINQIEINLKANRSVEPNHPNFPGLELFCHIYDIDIFFSDYVAANLMKIQAAMAPPPEPKPEKPQRKSITIQKADEEDDDDDDEETMRVETSKKFGFMRKKAGRDFEVDDESKIEELPEEHEDADNDENASVGEIKHMEPRKMSDVEEVQGSQNEIKPKSPPRIDQRVLLVFDKMRITVGEVASEQQSRDPSFQEIIDTHRSEIPHMNILEMILEGLEIEYDSGTQMNLHLIMTRLYIKDLQKVQEIRKNLVVGTKTLTPPCYQMILSNPDIEKEYDDGSSHYSMATKTVRTEDFISMRDEGSFVENPNTNTQNQLRLYVKMEGQTTDVEFLFSNLRLIVTLPILERLSKFSGKIAALQKESEDAKIKSKVIEVSRLLKKEDEEGSDSDDDRSPQQRATDVFKIQLSEMKKQKDKEAKGLFQRLREEREKYLMKGKELKIKIIDQNSKMNAKGRLKNFEIWIPLDSTDEYSRVLSLSLCMQVSYKNVSLIKHKINEITSQLIESVLHKDQRDANVMINHLTIMMYNRHLLQVQEDLTNEKLLLPSRISMVYDKFFNLSKDSDITNIELTIEPFDLKVGFRELENFRDIQTLFTDFQTRINQPPEVNETQEYEQVAEDGTEKELVKNIENQAVETRISFRNRKKKQFIKTNIRLISESINFSLMDDTKNDNEYPLINFNISKIIANLEQETGADDAASFILKKMGISEHPYMKLEAGLLLESNYFNIDSGSYEPLIEPWTFSSSIMQKTANSAQVVTLKSDEMLNLWVTYGMAIALKTLQTKMNQKSSQWEDEKQVEEAKSKSRRLTQNRTTSSKRFTKTKSNNDPEDEAEDASGFVFENSLGIGMRITLENFDSWVEQGIKFTDEDKDISVIKFEEWEEGENSRNVRLMRDLTAINKYVKKEQNGGKLVENFEDQIIRFDIYIEGFEPINGVPIEITGLRSYELNFEGQGLKKKAPKYQNSLIVNIHPEGNKK